MESGHQREGGAHESHIRISLSQVQSLPRPLALAAALSPELTLSLSQARSLSGARPLALASALSPGLALSLSQARALPLRDSRGSAWTSDDRADQFRSA